MRTPLAIVLVALLALGYVVLGPTHSVAAPPQARSVIPDDLTDHANTSSVDWASGNASPSARSDAVNSRDLDAKSPPHSDGRRFAGTVTTESGDGVDHGKLFVFERSPLPGENADEWPSVEVALGSSGRFDLQLPRAWNGPTVFATVVTEAGPLGNAVCSVSTEVTIVVPDPKAPPGLSIPITWADYKPQRAAMLLQSQKRDSGFGEGVWDPKRERAHLTLVDRKDKITGDLLLLVGELRPSGRIQMMAQFQFPSMSALETTSATDAGLVVSCALESVHVPKLQGQDILGVALWSNLEAASAMAPTDPTDGILLIPIAETLTYRASGRTAAGTVAYGALREGNPKYIEWASSVDATLTARLRAVNTRGEPIVGAYGSLVSRHPDKAFDGLHRLYARSDAEGWIAFVGLIRGRYSATVETETLGDATRVGLAIEVPGPDQQCVLPDAAVVRLVPAGQHTSALLDSLRGWYRPRDQERWVEATNPKWRFGQSGITVLPEPGIYEFVVSLPPWTGRSVANIASGALPSDLIVRMAPEVAIGGRVIDVGGEPRPDVTVAHASTAMEASSLPDWARSTSGTDGRFGLVLIPGGPGDLLAIGTDGRVIGRFPATDGDLVVPKR